MRFLLLFCSVFAFQSIVASEVSDLLIEYSKEKYPIHHSIEKQRPDVASLLLRSFPKHINAITAANDSTFKLALQNGFEELALELLDHGFSPNLRIVDNSVQMMSYPLYDAISAKSIQCVEKLLDLGADPIFIQGKWVQGNRDKISALQHAAKVNSDEICSLLLSRQAGFDVPQADVLLIKEHFQNEQDWPALHWAIYSDHKEAFDSCLKYGINPNHTAFCPHTAYQLALNSPNPYYTQALLDAGFDLYQAMRDAVKALSVTEIHKIAQHPKWSPPEAQGSFLDPAHILIGAVETNRPEIVEAVFQSGVKDRFSACERSIHDPEMVALFIQYDSVSSNALEWAIWKKSFESCRLLLDAGITQYARNYAGTIVKYGIDYVRLFHERTLIGPSMLHLATYAGETSIMQYLLESGVSDPNGWIACIATRRLDLLKLVVSYTPLTQDQKSQAIASAIKAGCSDIVEFLVAN